MSSCTNAPKSAAASAARSTTSQKGPQGPQEGQGTPPASLASFGRIEATPIREVDPKRLPLETLRAVVLAVATVFGIRRPPKYDPLRDPEFRPAAGWATQTDAEFIEAYHQANFNGRCRVLPDAPSGRKRRQEGDNAYAEQWQTMNKAQVRVLIKALPATLTDEERKDEISRIKLASQQPEFMPTEWGFESVEVFLWGFTSTVVGSTTDTAASGTRTVRSRKSVGTPEWICPQQVGLSAG